MPLNKKGKKIMRAIKEEYGDEKGEDVFYASRNKGTIKNVENTSSTPRPHKKTKRQGNKSPNKRTNQLSNRAPSKNTRRSRGRRGS